MFCTPTGVVQPAGSADVPVFDDGVGVVEVLVDGGAVVVGGGGAFGAGVLGAGMLGTGVSGEGAVVTGGIRTGGVVEHGHGKDSQ
jgi:hypothetical protein